MYKARNSHLRVAEFGPALLSDAVILAFRSTTRTLVGPTTPAASAGSH